MASVVSEDYDPLNIKIAPTKDRAPFMDNATYRTRNMKSSETATTDLLVAGRNQLFLEPFDAFDPHHPLRGKKRFNENFRPLRSKISLKFGNDLIADVKKKQGMKLDIK